MLTLLADAIVSGLIKGAAAMSQQAVGEAYEAAKLRLSEYFPMLAPERVTEETREASTNMVETALGRLNEGQIRALAASFQLLAASVGDEEAVAVFKRVATLEDIEAAQDVIVDIETQADSSFTVKRVKSRNGKVDIKAR